MKRTDGAHIQALLAHEDQDDFSNLLNHREQNSSLLESVKHAHVSPSLVTVFQAHCLSRLRNRHQRVTLESELGTVRLPHSRNF